MLKTEFANQKGIIFYCDGGCRSPDKQPGLGNIGWGAHGYLFEDVKPTKGSGNQTHLLTKCGYIPKSEKLTDGFSEVKPLSYFDCFGSSDILNSNNVAEVEAITNAITKALDYEITSLTIYTDSQYAKRGVEEWHHTWLRNNWIRNDGTPVPNSFYWKNLISVLNKIRDKGVNVNVQWVKGHNEILGNTLADKLATLGVMYSLGRVIRSEFKVSQPEGYWKTEVDKHPFISSKRMFFNTITSYCIPGEYYLGEYKGGEESIGKKSAYASYLVVQLKEPDPCIEAIRKYQTDISNDIDMLMLLRLDKLYTPAVYHDVNEHGKLATIRANGWSSNLNALDGKPLSEELRPPMLALRAVENLSMLKDILEDFKASNLAETFGIYTSVDITSTFYVATPKKNKELVLKLKPEVNMNMKSIKIPYDSKNNFDVNLGSDCLSRNALKKLEETNITIYLIYWKESADCIRFCTVAKANEDYGIWSSVHSNLVFLK